MAAAALVLPARAPGARPLALRGLRTLAAFMTWFALGLGAILGLATAGAGLAGYKAMTVISGSMEPTIGVGSVVIDEMIAPLEARPGDVVTFPDPSRGGQLVTHRLVTARADGDTAFMVTRGDANAIAERWSVPADGAIGRVVTQVPRIGYIREQLGGTHARLGLLGSVLLLGCVVLVDIWRREPEVVGPPVARATAPSFAPPVPPPVPPAAAPAVPPAPARPAQTALPAAMAIVKAAATGLERRLMRPVPYRRLAAFGLVLGIGCCVAVAAGRRP